MKELLIIIFSTLFVFQTTILASQEWKNLKTYQRETENADLLDGCWLKKDRIRNTEVWKQANLYNLSLKNGFTKYNSIAEIRDFYLFFDEERKKLGHEIKWIGISAIVADQLAKIEIGFIRVFIVRNREVVKFAREGSEKVLNFTFPLLQEIYFSSEKISGDEARKWDEIYGMMEQCVVLDPMFNSLSENALIKLERMMKGKGIYNLGVPKELKFIGEIEDCKARFDHGIKRIPSYYDHNGER